MNYLWSMLILLLVALPAMGQQTPVLKTELEQTDAIPGTPLSLRLTVLVPTYLPSPPEWPGLEAPNLMVRLPERSTNPTSERVDGDTWAGITRHYRLYPMVAGDFVLPPQTVRVTYADSENGDRRQVDLSTDPLRFRGVVPAGTQSLDPFLAAESLELEQSREGGDDPMKPGDSLSWTVVAKVTGTSPMFLPSLLPELEFPGVAVYPDEPVVSETSDRGTMAGTRTESVTFVAQGGGEYDVPSVSLDWYNLTTGNVETASVEGFAFDVDGPPAPARAEVNWRSVVVVAMLLLLCLLAGFWIVRRWGGAVRHRWETARARRRDSETHAYRDVKKTIARRDNARLYAALDVWAARTPGHDPRHNPELRKALLKLGEARYGGRGEANTDRVWRDLERAVAGARIAGRKEASAKQALPPLNPQSHIDTAP
ncbi:BatD family protein [Marinobacter fonticola]|uniref:BatD family protein n=1 Tax=Marinobacter fonticola TaxID=2603215 RepID=UPI0011E69994|nr:BatD family protein [Marinobacter fonticola]